MNATVYEFQWSGSGDDVASDKINIGLSEDGIFQRYLLRRIFREVEFSIKERDGTVTVGFITGFDEKVIQISTSPTFETDEPRSVLIFWPIAKIEETGRKLDDVGGDFKTRIRSYSHALRSQCESILSGRGARRPTPVPDSGPA